MYQVFLKIKQNKKEGQKGMKVRAVV